MTYLKTLLKNSRKLSSSVIVNSKQQHFTLFVDGANSFRHSLFRAPLQTECSPQTGRREECPTQRNWRQWCGDNFWREVLATQPLSYLMAILSFLHIFSNLTNPFCPSASIHQRSTLGKIILALMDIRHLHVFNRARILNINGGAKYVSSRELKKKCM